MKKIYESPEIEVTLFKGNDAEMVMVSPGGVGDNPANSGDFTGVEDRH